MSAVVVAVVVAVAVVVVVVHVHVVFVEQCTNRSIAVTWTPLASRAE